MPSDGYGHFLRRLGTLHSSFYGDGEELLGRILITCEEMLRDRGFTVEGRSDSIESSVLNTQPVMAGRTPKDRHIQLFITAEEKVGIKTARHILDVSKGADAVVVSLEGVTPFTKKECDGSNIQFLLAKDMCVNKTHHLLVPKHTLVDALPPGITKAQLPRIFETDPIVQYYNFPVGSIVKVNRVFGGHEMIPYFRLVQAAIS